VEHSKNHYQFQVSDGATAAELIEQLNRFDGPPEQFLVNLLAVQCFLGRASAGAILRNRQAGGIDILAVYPQLEKGATAPVWLAQSVEFARKESDANVTTVKPLHDSDELYGQPAQRHLVMVPLKITTKQSNAETANGPTLETSDRLSAAFLVETGDSKLLDETRQRIELTTNLVSLYEMRLTLRKRQADLTRLKMAMETLSVVNRQNRFAGAAMTLCNEVASQWQCERVTIGFLKGRYVQLKAMSHTENFSRKMKVVQDIESAMEECLDQDIEILYPAPQQATYISRAASQLSKRHGPLAILSLPLRTSGETVAVLTLERQGDKPFNLDQVETARLTCELCTARLVNLYENDRWLGAKAAANIRSALAALVGPKHTWAKIAAILIFAAIVFLIFAKGRFRAQAPFVLEATQQQLVPAPFDGYIKSVSISVGDTVEADKTILAELETAELRLQLAAAEADKLGYEKQASAAMRDGDTAQAQIAQANADKIKAQIDLLQYQINQAAITSPIGGIVVKGDLKREIGAPVKTGDVLFEVAPLESLRAELMVPEDQIADIQLGQQGDLATASYPGEYIKFVVERINPMAEVVNERNIFKVRVRLLAEYPWMRPGMEGVAKVSIDKRSYAWIWTRKIVNWIRMKLWL